MRAIYDGIYRDLLGKVEEGEYPYQDFLPSESELVKIYNCSHNTVRRALALLADDGYVQPIHGKGVRVIYQPHRKAVFTFGGIHSFTETIEDNGLVVGTDVRTFEKVVTSRRLAEKTGFEEGQELWHIERVRTLDGMRLIRDINYFSCEQVPSLTAEIAMGSIYQYLENSLGLVLAVAKRTLTVERTTGADDAVLDVDDFDFLAVVTGQMFTQDGILFECTQSRYRPDYFAFSNTARRNR